VHFVVSKSHFTGLATAIRLRARGHDVALLDDHLPLVEQTIAAPWLLQELFDLTHRRTADYITLVPLDPFYTHRFDDGTTLRPTSRHDEMVRQIRALDPSDVPHYLDYRRAAARFFDATLANTPAPPPRIKFNSPHLRALFADPLTYSATQRWGTWSPLGGMTQLHTALLNLFHDIGGHHTPSPSATDVAIADQSTPAHIYRFDTTTHSPDIAPHEIVGDLEVFHSLTQLTVVAPPTTDRDTILSHLPVEIEHEHPTQHAIDTAPHPLRGLAGALCSAKTIAARF
jgi:hypothetical protein